jgi:hypothetical protein
VSAVIDLGAKPDLNSVDKSGIYQFIDGVNVPYGMTGHAFISVTAANVGGNNRVAQTIWDLDAGTVYNRVKVVGSWTAWDAGGSGGGGGDYDPAGTADAVMAAHLADADPHPQYLLQSEGDAMYDAIGTADAAVAAFAAESDPFTQYLTETRGDALYDAIGTADAAVAALSSVYQPLAAILSALTTRGFGTDGQALVMSGTSAVAWTDLGEGGGTLDPTLSAIGDLTPTTDQGIYFTDDDAAATFALTSFARTLLDDTSASNMRTTLGVAIGSNIQAWDPILDVLSTLTAAADKVPYFTATNAAALADFTTLGRTLAGAADAAAVQTAVDLVPGTDVQAQDASLQAYADLVTSANKFIYYTGADAPTLTDITATGRNIVAQTTTTNVRSAIGLTIGTDVQAHDGDLDTLAAFAKTKGNIVVMDGTGFNAIGVGSNDNVLVADSAQTLGIKWAALDASFLDLGSMADQNADDVDITGGTISGLASFGASALSVDTLVATTSVDTAELSASDVSLTGGTIDGVALTNVPDPTNDKDAANKEWVLSVIGDGTTNANLLAIAGLTTAADKLQYWTGSATAGLADFSSFARSIIDDANAAAVRTTIGAVIGTDVQAWDADLDTIAALAKTKGNLIVANGSAWNVLGPGTDGHVIQADSAAGVGLSYADPGSFGLADPVVAIGDLAPVAADQMFYWTSATAAATISTTSYGRGVLNESSASTQRTTLGLVIGTNVQAWDADLDAIAALAKTKGNMLVADGSTWVSLAVGGDDDVLYADSTQTAGVRWDSLPSGIALGDTLSAIDAATYSADQFIYFTDTNTPAAATVTSFARSVLDDVNAAGVRTTLGLVIGSDVQPYDADLAAWAAISPSSKQDADSELSALAGLTSAADRLPYFTGAGTASLATFTSAGRAILDDASTADQRNTLGVAIGTDVQAWDGALDQISSIVPSEGGIVFYDGSAFTALEPGEDNQILQFNSLEPGSLRWVDIAGNDGIFPVALNLIGELSPTEDTFPYYVDDSTAALGTITSFGRSLVDDANASTARATLGLSIGTDVQAYDTDLDSIAALTTTTFGRSLLTQADAAAARGTLGITVGTNVQAWDADLDAIAALSPSKGNILVGNGSAWTSLAVGSDNNVLTADGAQTTGVKWGAAPITDAELSAIAGLTSAADKLPYFTGSGTAALADFTSTARSLVDDTSISAMRATLGVVIGTNVQAWDADLDAIAALSVAKGTLLVGTASGWASLAAGSDDQVLTADSTATPGIKWGDGSGGGGSSVAAYRNRIVNPFGRWKQVGLGSQGDTVYGFDQWYTLVQTAAITTSQLTDAENGTPYAMRLTQSQATAQRFGIAQPLEALETKGLRGKNVSLKARVRCSNATALRYAIIEWTGTADSITKDVVASWTSSTYTPGNFFASSNLTITANDFSSLSADTWADITLTGTIGSSANNIIVVFWMDSTQAQGSTLDISRVWFGQGDAPDIVEMPTMVDDFARCERFFEKSYDPDETIGSSSPTGVPLLGVYLNGGLGNGTRNVGAWVNYHQIKVKVPTFTPYSTSGASGKVRDSAAGADINAFSATPALRGCELIATTGAANTQNNINYHYTADARL